MIHFCSEEAAAIMTAIPALGFFVRWLRVKFRRKGKACCPK